MRKERNIPIANELTARDNIEEIWAALKLASVRIGNDCDIEIIEHAETALEELEGLLTRNNLMEAK